MSFSCEPSELMSAAKCILSCIPQGLNPAAQTALLDLINGGPTATNVLLQNGKEYIWRVPPRMQVPLHIYLLLVVLGGQNRTVTELLNSAKCLRCIPSGMHPPVQTYEICEWNEGGEGGLCDDPVVVDWLERLANDFQPRPSDATITAVCDFCEALRISGIMDKMLVVNPIVWDTQMGANSFLTMRYPLIYQSGNGNSPFINHNFVAADLTVDGLIGDGATKLFNTGFIPSVHWGIGTTSSGISIYETEESVQALNPEYECAVETLASGIFILSTFEPTLGTGDASCWNVASQIAQPAADTTAFYSENRTSNTSLILYHASSLIPFAQLGSNANNQAGNPIPNLVMYFMADNITGISDNHTTKRISFIAIHEGLTAGESADLFNAVQDLRIALGGGYI